jgi:hypothetical protein
MNPPPRPVWPKLVEGRTYRYTMTAPAHMPIERTWEVGPATSMMSARRFRHAVATWNKRNWTVVIELVPEAPEPPQEPLDASEGTGTLPEAPEAHTDAHRTIVGALLREEDGYCYVQGLPQALRRGYDIEAMAQVGDSIVCNYGKRSYGYGWYGKVLETLSI